jgi:hypothetical protein
MRNPDSAPSLVPKYDVSVYDFGAQGRAYREADEAQADMETVIVNILRGEYNSPQRIVVFNTAENWSAELSEDVAWEVLKRTAPEGRELASSKRGLYEFHVGENETLGLYAKKMLFVRKRTNDAYAMLRLGTNTRTTDLPPRGKAACIRGGRHANPIRAASPSRRVA